MTTMNECGFSTLNMAAKLVLLAMTVYICANFTLEDDGNKVYVFTANGGRRRW